VASTSSASRVGVSEGAVEEEEEESNEESLVSDPSEDKAMRPPRASRRMRSCRALECRSEFQRFFTAFSERPGRPLAISTHLGVKGEGRRGGEGGRRRRTELGGRM
jgi:hypothetical protein